MLTTKKKFDHSREKVRLRAIANLLYLLINIYGLPETKKRMKKIDGKEFIIRFPALNGAITYKISGDQMVPYIGESKGAIGRLTFKVKEEKIMETIEQVIKMPGNNTGFLRLVFKYLLTGKIGFGGAMISTMRFVKSIMLGKHEMYKIEKTLRESKNGGI
ncbi:MAG: hypothetical protein ACTSRW_05015 [Candidatus Helarchaeota archaeon]